MIAADDLWVKYILENQSQKPRNAPVVRVCTGCLYDVLRILSAKIALARTRQIALARRRIAIKMQTDRYLGDYGSTR